MYDEVAGRKTLEMISFILSSEIQILYLFSGSCIQHMYMYLPEENILYLRNCQENLCMLFSVRRS